MYGIVRVVNGDLFLGPWYALIAYFLFNAASQSLQQESIAGIVAAMRVAPLMTTGFTTTPPNATVASVVRDLMLPHSLRAVPVVDGSEFLGFATSEGVRALDHDRWSTTAIDHIMTRAADLDRIAPDDLLASAIERFGEQTVLPVLRNGALVGLLDRDIVVNYVRARGSARR